MVHSSQTNVPLGREGMPTPAMLAARTWNWYFLFSFKSDTWTDSEKSFSLFSRYDKRCLQIQVKEGSFIPKETKWLTHSVGSVADSLDVGLVPCPWHPIDDLTVVHEVAGDVSASDEGGLLPGQHHRVPHALQNADAIGWGRGRWDSRGHQLASCCVNCETRKSWETEAL